MGARVFGCASAQEKGLGIPATEGTAANGTNQDHDARGNNITSGAQIRLLSLSACMMETFSAIFDGGRQNALQAAKRCVRSHGYPWATVRTCVWDQHVVNLPPRPETVSSFNLIEIKASVCTEIAAEGVFSVVCDTVLDQYDELLEEQHLERAEPVAYVHDV